MPKRFLIAILMLALPVFGGCEGPYYRSFAEAGRVRDRALSRQAALVGEACDAAERQALSSTTRLREIAANGTSAHQAGIDFERELRRCESRVKLARDRAESLAFAGQTSFERWELELDDYRDPALREASKKALGEVRSRHHLALEQIARALDRTEPFLALLADQARLLVQTQDESSRRAVVVKLDLLDQRASQAQDALRVGATAAKDYAAWIEARRSSFPKSELAPIVNDPSNPRK